MIEIDGICYADDMAPLLEVTSIRALDGYRLHAYFTDGTEYITDMAPLLNKKLFAPLRDFAVFRQVSAEDGAPSWVNGAIDIAPEWLQNHGERVTKDELD